MINKDFNQDLFSGQFGVQSYDVLPKEPVPDFVHMNILKYSRRKTSPFRIKENFVYRNDEIELKNRLFDERCQKRKKSKYERLNLIRRRPKSSDRLIKKAEHTVNAGIRWSKQSRNVKKQQMNTDIAATLNDCTCDPLRRTSPLRVKQYSVIPMNASISKLIEYSEQK